ncbi:MAG: phytoene/squalene synthase family protein, partial [Verrucomicrobiota bacterium]|nr:phytoene/squalene synthase family protein [Verrucomicrobiota bacterium]
MKPAAGAREITKASKSNLALAFFAVPRERRDDITTFYAFCRVVDDIADDATLRVADKKRELERWRAALEITAADEPSLGAAVREIIAKYQIPVVHFHEIIDGVEMDLGAVRYETFEGLRAYCYRVASAVGLVSIRIFGTTETAAEQYAIDLGIALQLTNILRDVAVDLANGGRIYLPVEDMARCGFSPEALANRETGAPFRALMEFEADRARAFFQSAVAALPPADAN